MFGRRFSKAVGPIHPTKQLDRAYHQQMFDQALQSQKASKDQTRAP